MSKRKPPPASLPSTRPVAHSRTEPDTLSLAQALQRAIGAYERGEWVDAERLCRWVLDAEPDHFDALHLCGIVVARIGRTQEAADLLLKAVSVNPNVANAYYHRGIALGDLQRHAEALESYDRALALKPDHARAWNNRGNALGELQRHGEALASYDRALALKPDYAEAHNNRGVTLADLQRPAEALESYDRALALKPDYAAAHNNRGVALATLQRTAEALDSYGQALRIKPDYDFLYGRWLHARMKVCDWDDIASHFVRLQAKIERHETASPPFPVLAMPSSPALQRMAAEIWVGHKHSTHRVLPAISKRPRRDRIRVGYFSADLHEHATSHLAAGLFERHDRSKFQVTAFSFGPDTADAMRQRLAAGVDQFIDVRTCSDTDVATLARTLEIDIAVDLKGFTQDARTGVFALRAAPIQVNFLGYPGTMGAGFIDYIVADATLIPRTHQQHYAEAIAYLPNSYQPNDARRPIADRTFGREALGLAQAQFVFCCFNSNYKITPGTFDSWMRILEGVDGSVLWLLEDNTLAASNLRKEAALRGVSPDRLVFAALAPMPEHLARHRCADLFLDTWPYNAHTTGSDALWTGLPLLTCVGETFAGRVGASLLNGVRLAELITSTPEQYEGLAMELAKNPDRLREIRQALARNRHASALFDIRQFARHIEAAFTQMYERHQSDLAPEHIYVRG